jgi:PHD/YefM family antitoxin component YafN of YafNO toxin-antitoxin module
MRKFQEQYVVNERGQKTAVIIPVEEYEELLEDIHDLAIIAERRDEPTMTSQELKRKLKEDWLL